MEVQLVNPWRSKTAVKQGALLAGHIKRTPGRAGKKGKSKSKALANYGTPIVLENRSRRRSPRRYANPLILPNRRRRRRNPANLMATLKTTAIGAGVGGGVFLLNKYAISKIGMTGTGGTQHTKWGWWVRQLVRFGAGAAAAYFFPGVIGASVIGSMAYPLADEVDNYINNRYTWATTTTATSARLEDVEAELADVLDGVGAYDYAY